LIKNLFIIGNGFDLGHRLPTSYDDFKQWLIEEYPSSQEIEKFIIADPTLMPDGDSIISDEDLASFLVYCINEAAGGNWENFEEELGKIEWALFFDDIEDVLDKDGDVNPWRTAYIKEDLTSTLYSNSKGFSGMFSQWIETISYPKDITKNSFISNYMKGSSVFLTFNYTKTLEDIYEIASNQICHIHGAQGGDIIIGHGVEKVARIPDVDSNGEYLYDSDYPIGMEGLDEIDDLLRKPTQEIIETTPLFEDLKTYQIENIFSWGFSFSNVDLVYIKEICKVIDTHNITWHLHDRGNGNVVRFKNILIQAGFKGTITTFEA